MVFTLFLTPQRIYRRAFPAFFSPFKVSRFSVSHPNRKSTTTCLCTLIEVRSSRVETLIGTIQESVKANVDSNIPSPPHHHKPLQNGLHSPECCSRPCCSIPQPNAGFSAMEEMGEACGAHSSWPRAGCHSQDFGKRYWRTWRLLRYVACVAALSYLDSNLTSY